MKGREVMSPPPGPAGAGARVGAMNADDSATLRDLLANNRTLLAFIRTALSFAGLGFAVAKFGLSPSMTRTAGLLGTFTVAVGVVVAVIGFAQHRAVIRRVGAPSEVPEAAKVTHTAAAVGCVLVCTLLAVYLGANIK